MQHAKIKVLEIPEAVQLEAETPEMEIAVAEMTGTHVFYSVVHVFFFFFSPKTISRHAPASPTADVTTLSYLFHLWLSLFVALIALSS